MRRRAGVALAWVEAAALVLSGLIVARVADPVGAMARRLLRRPRPAAKPPPWGAPPIEGPPPDWVEPRVRRPTGRG